jgi:hypothetical protein
MSTILVVTHSGHNSLDSHVLDDLATLRARYDTTAIVLDVELGRVLAEVAHVKC